MRPTASALLARAEIWRPWRAYAAQHLWAADASPSDTSQPDKIKRIKPDADQQQAA